jgi:hypothetical protein
METEKMTDKIETLEQALEAIEALKANNAALLAEKREAADKAKQASAQAGTLEQRLAQLEGSVNTLTKERDAARAESYNARVKDALDPVLEAAKVASTAKPDVLARLNAEAELTEAGFVSKKDGAPVVIDQWIEGLRESAPHYWPASQGGGASGSGGGHGGGGTRVTVKKSEGIDRYAAAVKEHGRGNVDYIDE